MTAIRCGLLLALPGKSLKGHEERFPPTRLSAGCGFRLFELGAQLRIAISSNVAPAGTSWPRTTEIFARRPETRAAISIRVLCASPCTSKGSGRARYQIAKPIIAMESTPVIAARGLSRGLRRAVAAPDSIVARSSVEGGAVDGGASVIVLQPL